jgi:hypothetical protein
LSLAIERFVPTKKYNANGKRSYKFPLDEEVRELIREKGN